MESRFLGVLLTGWLLSTAVLAEEVAVDNTATGSALEASAIPTSEPALQSEAPPVAMEPPLAPTEEPADESVPGLLIEPVILRTDLEPARVRSRDLELGLFLGQYSAEDFGVSSVMGLNLAYHVSPDWFVEGVYARTTLETTSAESLAGFELLDDRDLVYYDVSLAWQFMPGETFLRTRYAYQSGLYAVVGYGVTAFADDNRSTLNYGAGFRLVMLDWLLFRVDFRNHLFRHDLFVKEKLTNNFQMQAGVSVFF
jgi:outer membrane beta-barrel protein